LPAGNKICAGLLVQKARVEVERLAALKVNLLLANFAPLIFVARWQRIYFFERHSEGFSKPVKMHNQAANNTLFDTPTKQVGCRIRDAFHTSRARQITCQLATK
jgi:hypothetical protein